MRTTQLGARHRGADDWERRQRGDRFFHHPDRGAYSVCSTETTEWRAGAWHFLCCSWDGKEQRLYVDGKLEGTRSQAHSHEGANLIIGSSEFEGTVDEILKWSRALSESEIAELFRSTGG